MARLASRLLLGIGTGSAAERDFVHSLWTDCAGDDQALFWAAAVEDCAVHGGRTYAYLEKVINVNLEQDSWPGWKGVSRAGAAVEWAAGAPETEMI